MRQSLQRENDTTSRHKNKCTQHPAALHRAVLLLRGLREDPLPLILVVGPTSFRVSHRHLIILSRRLWVVVELEEEVQEVHGLGLHVINVWTKRKETRDGVKFKCERWRREKQLKNKFEQVSLQDLRCVKQTGRRVDPRNNDESLM